MADFDSMNEYREKQRNIFSNELKQYGSYEEWYENVEPFRKTIIDNYMDIYVKDKLFLNKLPIFSKNGNFLDHHLGGYISPLDITNIGWGGEEVIKASEQIIQLDEQFKKHGIRFIYAALPCKLAVYPEYIFDFDKYNICHNVIP